MAPQRVGSAFETGPLDFGRLLAASQARCLKEIPSPTDFAKGEGFAFY